MLPKSRRIPKEEFKSVQNQGRRYSSATFSLFVAKNNANSTKPSRFSFSVSKKISKKATDRNSLRRKGYSAIQHIINRVNPGYLFFFSFKKGGVLKLEAIEKEISELLSSATMLS